MKNILLGTFMLLLLGATAASAQTVSGSLDAAKRGGTTRGKVVLSIPGGLHVNSNRPNSKFAIATVVSITVPGGRVGAIVYPRGKNRKFQFSDDTLNVYEGTVVFPFAITLPAGFRGNNVRVRAVVRYQACTEEVCYPPASKDVTLTASVK